MRNYLNCFGNLMQIEKIASEIESAFEGDQTRIFVIAGASYMGKTTLIEKELLRRFIKAPIDEENRRPFCPLPASAQNISIEAFSEKISKIYLRQQDFFSKNSLNRSLSFIASHEYPSETSHNMFSLLNAYQDLPPSVMLIDYIHQGISPMRLSDFRQEIKDLFADHLVEGAVELKIIDLDLLQFPRNVTLFYQKEPILDLMREHFDLRQLPAFLKNHLTNKFILAPNWQAEYFSEAWKAITHHAVSNLNINVKETLPLDLLCAVLKEEGKEISFPKTETYQRSVEVMMFLEDAKLVDQEEIDLEHYGDLLKKGKLWEAEKKFHEKLAPFRQEYKSQPYHANLFQPKI